MKNIPWSQCVKISLSALIMVACGFTAPLASAQTHDDPIRLGFVSTEISIHPTHARTEGANFIVGHLFLGLLKYQPGEGLVPLLAESWERNDDATEYRFTIREGMAWSDGTPITAESIAESFRLVASFEESQHKADFENVQIDAVTEGDRDVVRFQLPEPHVAFLQLLALKNMAVLPVHLSDDIDFSADWEAGLVPDTLVYSGPYMVEAVKEDHLVMRPNPAYDLSELANTGVDLYWDDLSDGPLGRERAVIGDLLDAAFVFGPKQFERLTGLGGFAIDTVEPMANETYFVNPRKAPLNDIEIRRAIAYAMVDRMPAGVIEEEILRPFRSLLPTALLEVVGEVEPYYFNEDPVRLLDEAGEIMRSKGYSAENPLKLRITYNNPPDVHERVARVVRSRLARIHIEAELVPVTWSNFLELLDQGDFDLMRHGAPFYSLDILPPLQAMTTDDPENYVGFSNPEYDRIVAQVAAATNPEERYRLAQEAFDILNRNYVNLPMHMPLDGILRRADVSIGRVSSETWPLLTEIGFTDTAPTQ